MLNRLPVGNGGTRIRLSAKAIEAWGVSSVSGSFQCIGVFREDGELICAPAAAKTDADEHPFESVLHLDKLERPPALPATPINKLPTGFDLVAAARIIHFDAKWTGKQLDLPMGKDVFDRLGCSKSDPFVYFDVWGGTIILLSEARYEALRAKPILERG